MTDNENKPVITDPVYTATEAFQQKAQAIAAVLAPRLGASDTDWQGFTYDEQLSSQQMGDGSIKYYREDHPGAVMFIAFFEAVDADAILLDKVEVLKSDILESYSWHIDINEGTTYSQTLTHTFSSTITEESAIKEAVKAAAQIEAGWNPSTTTGGVYGRVTISGSYERDQDTTKGKSETTSDTVSRQFTFTGPKHTTVVAERSKQKQRRHMNLKTSYNFKTYFQTDSTGYQFSDFRDVFLPQLEGREPKNTDYTPFAANSSIREVMEKQPLRQSELNLLLQETDTSVGVSYVFDHVESQSIQETGA